MTSGVTCQVRLPRLLKPDSVSREILRIEVVGIIVIVAASGRRPALEAAETAT